MRLRTLRATTALSLTLGVFLTLPAIAAAQDVGGAPLPPPPQAGDVDAESDELDEVIVTAQRRAQRLQDVPIAITVITGEQVENSGAANIEGLQQLVPTLNFRESVSTIDSSVFLRGVGTINFSIAAEPSVAFVIDGVVQARAGEAFGDLYDIERVEVLRGPQGTLFGKNASAGAINIISRKPGDVFSATLNVSAYQDEEYRVRGAMDVPLAPNVRSRFTAFYGNFDGFIRNLTYGEDVNGYERWGVRGIIEADVTPALTLTLIGDYRKADDDCCAEVIGTTPTGANPLLSQAGIDIRGDETREVRNNLINRTQETSWGLSLQADYDAGELGVFTSITAYRDWENNGIRDGDYADQVFVGVPQVHDYGPQPSSTFSQELRITSPGGRRLEYVAGLYYYLAEAERTFQRDDIVCSATPCSGANLTFPSSKAVFGSEIENMAVYGQATLNVTDVFRLILGGRLTKDEVRAYHDRVPSPIPGPGVRTDLSGFRMQTEEENFSARLGAQYNFSPDLMGYVTYAQGYKGPAFNVFFNQNPDQTNVIEAETADSYEGGVKATLLDGRLLFNTAVFYAQYDNFQANSFDLLNNVVITRLTNAGTVSTKGFEIDFLGRVTPNLRLTGGVAYTDAQIDEFRLPPGSPAGSSTREGEQLPLAPKWKGTVGLNWKIPLAADPFDLEFGAQLSHTSSQVSDLQANPVTRAALTIEGYSLLDLNLAVIDDAERYRLNLMVRNVGDESYASLITPGGPGGSFRYLIPRQASRYFGVDLRLNFGAR